MSALEAFGNAVLWYLGAVFASPMTLVWIFGAVIVAFVAFWTWEKFARKSPRNRAGRIAGGRALSGDVSAEHRPLTLSSTAGAGAGIDPRPVTGKPVSLPWFLLLVLVLVASQGCLPKLPPPPPDPDPKPPASTLPPTPPTPPPPTTLPPAAADCGTLRAGPEPVCATNDPVGTIDSLYAKDVQEVLAAASGCEAGSTCPVPDWRGFTLRVMRGLNARGYCATYDTDHGQGQLGLASELSMRRDRGSATENLQIRPTGGNVRWLPGALRSRCAPARDTRPVDEVEALWQANPIAACPLPWGPGRWVEVAIENIGHPPQSQQATAATKWCSEVDRTADGRVVDEGTWPFDCGTKCCRIGQHEGAIGLACEAALFGVPRWTADDSVRLVALDNPFNVKVADGEGQLRVCGSVPGPDGAPPCASAHVLAQVGPVVSP